MIMMPYGRSRRSLQLTQRADSGTPQAKVTERLAADAPDLERPGADLIAWYLCLDRHPVGNPWSRRHADAHDFADRRRNDVLKQMLLQVRSAGARASARLCRRPR
jgi:hypothetical protein